VLQSDAKVIQSKVKEKSDEFISDFPVAHVLIRYYFPLTQRRRDRRGKPAFNGQSILGGGLFLCI
jgi:hypothetical protein